MRRPQAAALLLLTVSNLAARAAPAPRPTTHGQLVALFEEWRAFQRPTLRGGIPDYSAAAMATQQKALPTIRRKLEAFDRSGWSPHDQIDWYLLRAEMAGLDFDHRVLRPWANDPAFYRTVFEEQSDQPAREGPWTVGAVELWKLRFPLDAAASAELAGALHTIPDRLEQARKNLVGRGRDLWIGGAHEMRAQAAELVALAKKIPEGSALAAEVQRARQATEAFAQWIDQQLPSKTAPSGIGVAHYDWYLKHVQLVPWTWRDEVALMERELARAWAFLALEERRNSGPQPQPIDSADEWQRRSTAAVAEYVAYLKAHDILTVQDWMEPALLARVGHFSPGPLEFFSEVDRRDPEVMRTHGYHWFDLGRMERDPNPDPIRRGPLLYNIFNTRTEGHATGWEEMMLQAGMFDARPRSRELIYVALAERAARALGELRMQANQVDLEGAAKIASTGTPRDWLKLTGKLVRGEQHLYLRQPGYGTSYVVGKIEIERLMEARRRKEGDRFSLRGFMDAFDAAGLVPASLLRWELTGELPDDVKTMLAD